MAAKRKPNAAFMKPVQPDATLAAVLPDRPIPHLYADQDLDVALRYTQEWPLIPVVRRTNISQLQGVIDLADVLGAYRRGG